MRILLLLLVSLAAPATAPATAWASVSCNDMLMPPPQLREVSRGFSPQHSGVDLMAPYGSPIRAAAGGTVVYAGWYFAYGRIVDIQHAEGMITRYAHMADYAPGIRAGAAVADSQVIGHVGTSGRAHGAHVHFEVRLNGRAVDPAPYLGLAACPVTPAAAPVEAAAAPDTGRRDR
jgi:murein DD-endopeptidase MepM/ murein hydrolase activator NlpD